MLKKHQADPATDETRTPMQRLLAIMARLRDPEGGCPWDLEQTFATIAQGGGKLETIENPRHLAKAKAKPSQSSRRTSRAAFRCRLLITIPPGTAP